VDRPQLTVRDPQAILKKILRVVEPYEFQTFVLGFERPEDYDREAHEARFRELKIELGVKLESLLRHTTVDVERPELRIDVRSDGSIHLQPAPLFIAGRYRKLSREIPASRWVHHECRGRGCPSCGHRGTLCGPSIEEMLSAPVLELSRGTRAFFHGMGREDVDARMLGRGRPFVLEVHRPLRRTLPLRTIQKTVCEEGRHLAEVSNLIRVDRSALAAVKGTEPEKSYRAWVRVHGATPLDARQRVAALEGTIVAQLSPTRVMQRRGETTCRHRGIVESTWLGDVGSGGGLLVWEVRVQAGTYVKELVSGDDGRTTPSLTQVLGVPCHCEALDVIEIHWRGPWE
jgi:tRNA pseudouridine synthase 10